MMWLTSQFTVWQEILFGFIMLALGLFLEDWIDRWRGRKGQNGNGYRQTSQNDSQDPAMVNVRRVIHLSSTSASR